VLCHPELFVYIIPHIIRYKNIFLGDLFSDNGNSGSSLKERDFYIHKNKRQNYCSVYPDLLRFRK
jgi:hypothetical protein